MKNEMDASEQVSASPQYAIEEAARRAREVSLLQKIKRYWLVLNWVPTKQLNRQLSQ